jgi:uncharacterized protein YlxW (UPF0749 family)
MTSNMEEWQPGGVILYTESNHLPRLKIITREHTYEIQACKFHPIMERFAVLVDGKFEASRYDSIDRLLKLDEVSKSDKCSEREKMLADEIKELQNKISIIENEKDNLEIRLNDRKIIMFDAV